jgi:integrase/recombinase XerC
MDAPFQPLVQPFIDYLKFEKRYSPHTVRSYQDDLIQFFQFLNKTFGDVSLNEIISSYVRSWLASLKEEELTARSINRKLSTLKSFFKYQVRTGELQQTPMTNVIAPKASKRLPSFIPETDLAALLYTLRFTEDWKGLNAKMLLSLFYFTGMRLSELINLKERQIDKSKRVIKILGKGNKERIVPISPELIKMIDEYIDAKKKVYESPEEFLLVTEKGKRMYPKYAYLLTRQYLATIKTLEKKSPHTLRHTFATHLTNHGANLNAVKELLGHASLASTQVYTHNTIEKLKEVYKKAHPKEQK